MASRLIPKPRDQSLKARSSISAMRKKHDLPLSTYCESLKKYLNHKLVVENFDATYNKELGHYLHDKNMKHLEEEKQIVEIENRSKADLLGVQEIGITLDMRLQKRKRIDQQECDSDSEELLRKMEKDAPIGLDGSVSAGTRIKHVAIRHHQTFKQNGRLSSSERKTMSSGLSSIIDFIDLRSDGQKSAFDSAEWDSMVAHYTKKYHVEQFDLPDISSTALEMAAKICEEEDISAARSYISSMKQGPNMKREVIKSLEVIDQALISLQRQTFCLDPLNATAVTEYDYTSKIWLPLFDSLFSPKNKIRTKVGESSSSISSDAKKTRFLFSAHVHSFKVDVRFIFDRSGREYDVASLEAARDSQEAKAHGDLGKLVREGKDVLDGLVTATIEDDACHNLKSWIIQMSGLHGELSTIHLDQSGLYVAIPQFKIMFPSSTSSLRRFSATLKALLIFSRDLERTVSTIEEQITLANDRRISMGITWDRPSETIPPSPRKQWQRPTWYSPPRNEPALSRVPSEVFGLDDEE